MKILIILFVASLVLESCSTKSTEPEEKSGQSKASSFATRGFNEVFVTTPEELYRSNDNGRTWGKIYSFRYANVYISPNGTIFCTNHKSTGTYTSEETLWRSTDGGNTFISTGWSDEISADGLMAIDFNNQGHLFARKHLDGLYRSTDQGESWDKLAFGVLTASAFIAPDDLFWAYFDCVFRSEDNGDNWLKVFEMKDHTGDITYSCVALAFNSTNRIFCGINASHFMGDSVETGKIYFSDDNGNNWVKGSTLNYDIKYLSVNSKGNIFAFTEKNQIFISTDNGQLWNWVSTIFPNDLIDEIAINNNDYIFIRTYNNEFSNVYTSLDDCLSWEQIWPYNK